MQLAESLSAIAASAGPGAAPVVVRNMLPGIVCFTDENTRISVTWQGHGDVNGGDVKEVSPTLMANPQFREQVLRGIFSVERSAEVLQAALDLQRNHWNNRQLALQNASAEIEKANDTVIASGQPCIAAKGRELCGSYALVMGKNPDEQPPLCQDHAHLVTQYAPTETGRARSDGKPEIIWKRVSVTHA